MSNAKKPSVRQYISVSPMVKKAMPGFKISRAVRAGPWLFTNGQMDLSEGGKVLNAGDLMAQTMTCMRSIYEVVAKAGCSLSELAQLQIFYLAASVPDERIFRNQILEEFPECTDVLMIMTPVPSFATIGSEVEIDAIAVKGHRAHVADADGLVRGVRRGDWVFAKTRVEGTVGQAFDDLYAVLARLACKPKNICRLYAYYPSNMQPADRAAVEHRLALALQETRSAYHAALLPAKIRGRDCVELEIIAYAGDKPEKSSHGSAASPAAGPFWPFANVVRCAGVVFASGQFPVNEEGTIIYPGNIADQARQVMLHLEKSLAQAGAKMDDLVKIKTYYEGAWDKENWFDNLRARMERLSDPGPASSGIEGLLPVISDALLSVDGIAVLEGDHVA